MLNTFNTNHQFSNSFPMDCNMTSNMTSNMPSNMPSQMTTPGFFLYRTSTTGESFDPTAAIQFYPAKDSDELFDALRAAYPATKTHSERMRDAVIDFLMRERTEEQAKNNVASTPSTWSSWPSNSSSSSNLSSPDLIDLATPASVASPMPSMSRELSRSSNGNASLEQMTGVFSLSSGSQPKTRIRRKMTDSEKAEYRKRRIVKACDKCSKRKRKCQHNQEQMEVLAPSSSSKVTKKKSPSTNAASFRQVERTPPPSSAFALDPLSFLNDDSLFSFESVAQETVSAEADLNLMDFDFGQQSAPATAWPWSDTQDWTLLDAQSNYNTSQSEPLFGEISTYVNQPLPPQRVPSNNISLNFDHPTTQQAATHTLHTHADLKPSGDTLSLSDLANFSPGIQDLPHAQGVSPVLSLDLVDSNGSAQPMRSKRHYAGFDIRSSLGQSSASSAGIHGIIEPARTVHQAQSQQSGLLTPEYSYGEGRTSDGTTVLNTRPQRHPADGEKLDLPSFSSKAGTPSRSVHPGFVVNDQAAAYPGATRVIIDEEQSTSERGIGQTGVEVGRLPIKNKGPEYATRGSAASAGSGTIDGGRMKSPLGNFSHSQESHGLSPPRYLSNEQSTAERTSTAGLGSAASGHTRLTPAMARGLDFASADTRDTTAHMPIRRPQGSSVAPALSQVAGATGGSSTAPMATSPGLIGLASGSIPTVAANANSQAGPSGSRTSSTRHVRAAVQTSGTAHATRNAPAASHQASSGSPLVPSIKGSETRTSGTGYAETSSASGGGSSKSLPTPSASSAKPYSRKATVSTDDSQTPAAPSRESNGSHGRSQRLPRLDQDGRTDGYGTGEAQRQQQPSIALLPLDRHSQRLPKPDDEPRYAGYGNAEAHRQQQPSTSLLSLSSLDVLRGSALGSKRRATPAHTTSSFSADALQATMANLSASQSRHLVELVRKLTSEMLLSLSKSDVQWCRRSVGLQTRVQALSSRAVVCV